MNAYDRAAEIVGALEAAGVRATVDPSAVHAPCVLVPPPSRTYDQPCGYAARWELVAIAPAALGADRSTWLELDRLVNAVASVADVTGAELASYQLGSQTFPAYLVAVDDTISD